MQHSYTRLIRSLATKLWISNVREKMGGISYGRIQKILLPDDKKGSEYWSSYSRRFYRNSKGVPIRDRKIIAQVESIIPGTERILTHPLWDILTNPDASQLEIFRYMERLEFNLRKKLFESDKKTNLLIRKKLRSPSQIYYIALENNLDAFACLLMLIRESELQKKVQAYISCKREVVYLIYRLSLFPPYKEIITALYEIVYNLFIEKNHPLPPELAEGFWNDYPFSREIPEKHPLHIVTDIYSGVLWNAEYRKLVPSTEKGKLRFLFWVDHFFNKNELKKALIKMPSDFDITQPSTLFPPPLNKLMAILRGDSRKYLLQTGTFLF